MLSAMSSKSSGAKSVSEAIPFFCRYPMKSLKGFDRAMSQDITSCGFGVTPNFELMYRISKRNSFEEP